MWRRLCQGSAYYSHLAALAQNRLNLLKAVGVLLVVDLISFAFPLLTKWTVDFLQNEGWVSQPNNDQWWWLFGLAALFLVLIFLAASLRFYWRALLIWRILPVFHSIRVSLFQRFTQLKWGFLRQRRVGDLISAFSEDTDKIRMTSSFGALAILDFCLNALLFPPLLFWLSPQLAFEILPALFLAAVTLIIVSARFSHHYERVQDLIGEITARAFEISSHIRIIKSFAKERPVLDEFVESSRELQHAARRVAFYESFYVPTLTFFLGLATAYVLIRGSQLVIQEELLLSSLVAFLMYMRLLDWPLISLAWFTELFRSSKASMKRLDRLHDEKATSRSQDDKAELSRSSSLVEVCALSLKTKGGYPIFQNLSFSLEPGEWMGVTGPVGVGKTAFLESLCLQAEPEEGEIFIAGRALSEAQLSQILYAPQESYLFSKTLRQNLQMGPEGQAGDRELQELLERLAFDWKRIENRGGLWTRLGERGTNFSGGQRQRIAIARSILRKRRLYLFDDILSHLDAITEAQVFEDLKTHLPREAGVILVSQRFETLMKMDQLLIFEGGGRWFCGRPEGLRGRHAFLQRLEWLQSSRRSQESRR